MNIGKLVLIVLLALLPMAHGQAQTVNTFVAGALNTPQGVAFAANGNLYVANAGGNTLSVITPDGTINTVLGSGLNLPNGVAVDSGSNVYVANTGNSTVVKVTPGGNASVFAGAGQGLSGPRGLAFDGSGNLYVSDIGTRTIVKITAAGSVSTFVDNTHGFLTPSALAFDAAGNLYVTDPGSAKISKVTPAGTVSTFASGFFSGEGLAFDGSGNLYSTDDANGKIHKITPAGVASDFVSAFGPWGIASDGSGNFYFASYAGNTVNKLTGSGVVSIFASSAINGPAGLVFAPSGNLYVSNSASGTVSEVTPHAQKINAFASGLGRPRSLVRDSAGNFYVVDDNAITISKIAPGGATMPFASDVHGPMAIDAAGNIFVVGPFASIVSIKIEKITPAGSKSDYATVQGMSVNGMAVDGSGNLYVSTPEINFSTVHTQPQIVKITPSQTSTTFATGLSGALTLDGSSNLYVGHSGAITRIAPDGTRTDIVSDARIRSASALMFDALGNLYVADGTSNAVLQILLVSSPLVSAILPGSRSVQVGTPATVFSTIINTGSAALNNCRAFLPGTAPTALSIEFQTTDPHTNALTGTKNQSVSIAGNGSQSYVLGFNATAPLLLPSLPLVYACDAASPAPTSPGVNTVDLLFSASAVPDIIALAATATGDGILNVPFGQHARGAFAVATANVGSSGTLTVSTDTGDATLPVMSLVCPSDPVTGVCLQPEAASAQITTAAGATPTFSVFVKASADVPFNPASARIYLRFKDADGISHGSTSVAVRTP